MTICFIIVVGRTNTLTSQNVAVKSVLQSSILRNVPGRSFTALSCIPAKPLNTMDSMKLLYLPRLSEPSVSNQLNCMPVRTVIKFSARKGKRKTIKAVTRRFFRLHWGGWIRTRCGRHKKMWKKSSNLKHRLRQHVMVNATQAHLLDKMVTKFWKKPKYYIDDIYEPYHERTFYYARKKPMQFPSEPLTEAKSWQELSKEKY